MTLTPCVCMVKTQIQIYALVSPVYLQTSKNIIISPSLVKVHSAVLMNNQNVDSRNTKWRTLTVCML